MHRIMSSVTCLALPNFFILSYKRAQFSEKKFTEHKYVFDFV
jgi:hypothetical protein